MLMFLCLFSGAIFPQDMPELDPETAEIMKKYQNRSGDIPAEVTEYAGFLYLEIDNGILTASTNDCADRKSVEALLKHTAAAAAKIKWNSHFK